MKKFLLTIVALCSFSFAFAQEQQWWETGVPTKKAEPIKKELVRYEDTEHSGIDPAMDMSFFLAYEKEKYHLPSSDDGYALKGFDVGITVHGPIGKYLGLEIPISYKFHFLNMDNDGEFDHTKKFDWTVSLGCLLSTTFHLGKNVYLTPAIGPKFNFTLIDTQTSTMGSSEVSHDFISGTVTVKNGGKTLSSDTDDAYKYRKWFNMPLSMGVTLRCKRVGISCHYDWSFIDGNRKYYYDGTGYDKSDFKLTRNYLQVAFHYYVKM